MAAISALADAWAPRVLSLLRIVTSLLFIAHGTQKIYNFPPRENARPFELMTLSPGLAGILELGGGLLVLFGLFTRPVAFVLSGLMAFAYWMAHAPRSFYPILNGGDAAILYCFIFLYLACAGGGPWGVDAMLRKTKTRATDDASDKTDWAS